MRKALWLAWVVGAVWAVGVTARQAAWAGQASVAGGAVVSAAGRPGAARAGGELAYGLGDFTELRVDASLGASLGASGSAASLSGAAGVSVAAAWDVFTWVPAAVLGGGVLVQAGRAMPRVVARLELRRFVDFDWYVAGGAGVQWADLLGWTPVAHVGLFYVWP